MVRFKLFVKLFFIWAFVLFTGGCSGPEPISTSEIRLAISGTAFDLPLIAARESGSFTREGLDIRLEIVKAADLPAALAKGSVHGATVDPSILPALAGGLPAKICAGTRGACVELLAGGESALGKAADLDGGKIGVRAADSAVLAAASTVLSDAGVGRVSWIYLPEEDFSQALNDGRIDAAARWERADPEDLPDGAKVIYRKPSGAESGHSHGSGAHFSESYALLSDTMIAENPKTAAKILKAWLQGVDLVSEDVRGWIGEATRLGYITDDSQNERAEDFMYAGSVRGAQNSLRACIQAQKAAGLLPEDADNLDRKIFARLLPDWN